MNSELMNKNTSAKYKAIVIGVSAGGMNALPSVLSPLPSDFPIPVIIVQHINPDSRDNYLIEYLDDRSSLKVKEADEKEPIKAGNIYIAPTDYHLLVENDWTFSLSVDKKVQYSRPSVDVLFESAAETYSSELIGIILTGANSDGAEGLKAVKDNGGLTIVQDPETAESSFMPLAAIKASEVAYILSLGKIAELIIYLSMNK